MLDNLQQRIITKARPSAQRLAVGFMALVLLSLLGLDAWQIWTARDHVLREAHTDTNNLARSLAQHAESTVQEADTVLSDLVERVQVDGTGPAQLARLHRLMQTRTHELAQLHGLFLYDKNGNWLATANDVDPQGVNNADREYFQFHRFNRSAAVHIGPVIRSRTNNQLVIPVSRRVDAADGSFAGVVLATLDLEFFNRFYQSFDLDHQGVILLALSNGTVLARRPFDEHVIGTSLARGRVFSELLPNQPAGSSMMPSLIDGVARLFSYKALDKYPLVVEAAQSKDAIYATWYANLARSIVFLLLVGGALSVFGVILIREIQRSLLTEAKLRNAHAALEILAMQDALTGLANRRQLDAALPHEIGRARRSGKPLGLIMIDVDHFKRFNDLYGHPAGDQCLCEVGRAVLDCVGRSTDLVVRYGGEEMLVLLPESDWAGTWLVAEKILHNVRALAIHHAGNDGGLVTVSAGVHVWLPEGGETHPNALVQAADDALYKAKSHGRNRMHPPQQVRHAQSEATL
ncbi:sensor domain-containing diguanylate cyclase [Pseudomonas eucalypticola]|uniref:diguanylate cyclase n=1 Tax=Pseudomonas eucalypticola TaxID=2599595 RepID=A0A7D5D7U9_9PSED|nr:sensor domain-containing diguanylate cyclase [Pseudomonas eucalypticola]QKZ04916.1 sensor domain-containing diguanylate cyclase [Pseudomonas eucalypticola]